MTLTKQQKLDMLSKAIDAGFEVDLKLHGATFEEMDQAAEIFGELPRRMNCPVESEDESVWMNINCSVDNEQASEDKFEATIFIK